MYTHIIGDVIIYIGAVVAAAMAIVAAAKKFIIDPAAKKFTESMRDQVAPIDEKLQEIQREVQVNSGKSLKDLVIKGFGDSEQRMAKIEGEVGVLKDILSN
jgi:hypothetical protein